MILKTAFSLLIITSSLLFPMDKEPEKNSPSYLYRAMNTNVKYGSVETEAQSWTVISLPTKYGIAKFFQKQFNRPLKEALNELIAKESKTSFECSNAGQISFWYSLVHHPKLALVLEKNITDLENEKGAGDAKGYKVPFFLVEITLLELVSQFAESLKISQESSSFKTIQAMWDCVEALKMYTDLNKKVIQEKHIHEIPVGGSFYFANISDIKGYGKGENLFCVRPGYYYGFGPFFKEGPKTLRAIADYLQEKGEKELGNFFYQETLKNALNTFKKKNSISENMLKDHHPLILLNKNHVRFISEEHISQLLTSIKKQPPKLP